MACSPWLRALSYYGGMSSIVDAELADIIIERLNEIDPWVMKQLIDTRC